MSDISVQNNKQSTERPVKGGCISADAEDKASACGTSSELVNDEAAAAGSHIAASTGSNAAERNMRFLNGIWMYRDMVAGCTYRWDESSSSWVQSDKDYAEVFAETQPTEELLCSTATEAAAASSNDNAVERELDEFEYQLQQEELEKKRLAGLHNPQTTSSAKTYTDPNDGTVYEWDETKNAYFPKVTEDFLAEYMASYGETPIVKEVVPTSVALKERRAKIKQERKEKRQLAAEKEKKAGWFDIDEEHNTSVYISGLPLDINMAEFEELMAKCGVIARDLSSGKVKLKLYKDESGNSKGDGLCTYLKKESVDIALQILDGSSVRGKEIQVESAKFEMKGAYDPSKKKKRPSSKLKNKLKKRQEMLLDWRPEKLKGERPKSDCTVVIKNVFTLDEFKKDASLLFDYRDYLTNECAKYGTVRKVVLYDNNPEGVALVTFLTPTEADDCVTMMDWRYFKGRQLRASTWDGETKYVLKEDAVGEEERIANWEKFIETDSGQPSQPS